MSDQQKPPATFSSADTEQGRPAAPPWAHVDQATVDPVVPVPGAKAHPVYTWLEEHGARLGSLERWRTALAIGVGGLAGLGAVLAVAVVLLLVAWLRG